MPTQAQENAMYQQILEQAATAGYNATADHDPQNWFPCGSGYIAIKPRTQRFAKWLLSHQKELKDMFVFNSDGRKAVMLTSNRFGQAMNPQVSWCNTAMAVLRNYNIKCELVSYID